MDNDIKITDFFKIGEIFEIINSPFEYEEGKPIFMIYIEHVFNDPEQNIYFKIVTDKGLLVDKLMNLAYLTNNEKYFIDTDKVITQSPEFLEKVAPDLKGSLLKLINDKQLELDKIITLNNDLNVGEIIEYNHQLDTRYGKVLFLIYISSQTLTDDNGNALPILGEKYLPTLYLLIIHNTGRITRLYDKTAKSLFFLPDTYKITHKLIQDNPEILENYPGLLEPVPENERHRIIRLIEKVKSEQQPISESQKLPKGGRKKKSTYRKRQAKQYTFRKGGAKRSAFRKRRKSTFKKGGAKR
jgi:hypothetical protein